MAALESHDAVLGPALDGGYWSVGTASADAAAFTGVPMSTAQTLACQRRRFVELGLRIYDQPPMRDIDTIADARAVASLAPGSRFARTFETLR